MPTNAELKRRRTQSQRDRARNRRDDDRRLDRIITKVFKEFRSSELQPTVKDLADTAPLCTMQHHRHEFVDSMFGKDAYSDATIFIHGEKLHAHRFVICVQSQYFAKAFQDAFLEGEEGQIRFDEGSAMAYWRVFHYLYTGDYPDSLTQDGIEDDPEMLKDPRVYALADMFLIENLKRLSLAKLQARLKKNWQIKMFPACIREVYTVTSGSDPMRSAVAQTAVDHGTELQKEQAFLDLLYEGGDFVVDFYKTLRYIH